MSLCCIEYLYIIYVFMLHMRVTIFLEQVLYGNHFLVGNSQISFCIQCHMSMIREIALIPHESQFSPEGSHRKGDWGSCEEPGQSRWKNNQPLPGANASGEAAAGCETLVACSSSFFFLTRAFTVARGLIRVGDRAHERFVGYFNGNCG
jgi:hypothetical protein